MDCSALVDTSVSTVSIYGLADPRSDKVRYIGKAVSPAGRYLQHLQPAQLGYRNKKSSWLKSLLAAGLQPKLRILDTVPARYANRNERGWIAYYQALPGNKLTNSTNGGTGGAVTDPAARERIAQAHTGVKASAETRRKMSETARRRAADPVERARLRSIATVPPPVMPGETNPMARLTDTEVRELRMRAAAGERGVDLAVGYGITAASVSQIVRGQYRSTAGGPTRASNRKKPALVPRVRVRLTDGDKAEIRCLSADGLGVSAIARQLGIHRSHVVKVLAS